MVEIRRPAVAGMFYPANPEKLQAQLTGLFDRVEKKPKKDLAVQGIVAPHAGYVYSGLTAAYAYKPLAEKKYTRIIILSPSHREYFGGISIYDGDAWDTPLGRVKIAKDVAEKMEASSPAIMRSMAGHRDEHGVEVHLPFLQHLYGHDFEFVPVVMGDQSHNNIIELSHALLEVMDDDTLIVASSDLSHFYSKSVANTLDSVMADRIVHYDPDALENDLSNRITEACGGGLLVAMMKATKRAGVRHSLLLHRSDSGDVSGDNSSVVGYLAASFYN